MFTVIAVFFSAFFVDRRKLSVCVYFGDHFLSMQIYVSAGFKNVEKNDSFYVEGVFSNCINYIWIFDVYMILNQKASCLLWVFKFTFCFNHTVVAR